MKLYWLIFYSGFAILNIISCNNSGKNQANMQSSLKHELTILKNDSTYAFLANENDFPFSEQVIQYNLSKSDLVFVDSLLVLAIKEYNDSILIKYEEIKKLHPTVDVKYFTLDYSLYNYQIVSVVNQSGEKLVWINALCESYDYWRKDIAIIFDGGNCFFNLIINISKKAYFEFRVNGVA